MRKLVLLSILSLLMFSCKTSVGLVYDDTVPLEETAWILPYILGTITGYNGIQVNWKMNSGVKAVQVPAGDTLLEVNINVVIGNTLYRGEGLLFRYNLKKQKQYIFRPDRQNSIYGLRVHEYDYGQKISYPYDAEEHFVGFIPFLNVHQGPIILE